MKKSETLASPRPSIMRQCHEFCPHCKEKCLGVRDHEGVHQDTRHYWQRIERYDPKTNKRHRVIVEGDL